MLLAEAEKMAWGLMADFGLGEWRFAWNRRKRSLGLCRYRERRIELSVFFVHANDEGQVRETILHEIAHAIAGEKGGARPGVEGSVRAGGVQAGAMRQGCGGDAAGKVAGAVRGVREGILAASAACAASEVLVPGVWAGARGD